MRSLLGRFHRPMSRGLVNNMLTMNNLGDGSTLSLDFTTMGGVLDPRLTFSRASTATFVNSSGYVEYAGANMLVNSPMQDAASPASGWNFFSITGGTISIPTTGSRKVATTGASQQPFTHQTLTISQGLTFTLSLVVTEITGTISYQNICLADGAASAQLWVNGVNITATSSQAAVGNYCLIFVGGSGSHTIRIGTGASSGSSGVCSMTFNSARVQPGSFTTTTYIPSTLSAAYHAPRFDYSPTTVGSPNGLLIEGAATNLTKFSETFTNAYWNTTANNVTAADSVATSPTGVALTASTLTEIAGTGSHHVHQLVGEFTPAASTAYTMSCFVKQPTSNAIRYVQLAFWSAGFGLTAYMNYDLQTGTVGTGGAGITASSITQYPNGWYRITARATSVAVPGVSGFQLGFSTTSGAVRTESYTASAPLKSIQLFGAQVEVGSGASSYIVTGASQVTRNADDCYISGSNFTSWFDSTQGTLLVTARSGGIYYDASAFDFAAVLTQSGTGSDHIGCAQWSAGLYGVVRANNTYNLNYTSLGSLTAPYKAAIAYAASDFAAVANNGTVTTGTGSLPLSINRLRIGGSRSGSAPAGFSGQIASIKYYPTRLPNAQLQALTTP